MNANPILAFRNVNLAFPDGKTLFDDLSFAIEQGAFCLVKGPSGSGKSTLLRLMCRLSAPSSGDVLFNGKPVSEYHPPELRRSILYFQQTPTVLDASVRENLLLPFTFKVNRDMTPPEDDALKRRMDQYRLGDIRLDQQAKNLSVGQQQRLCLIRGLLLNPDMILLDEPVSALDDESGRIVESAAERLCIDAQTTVVMVSHRRFDPSLVTPAVLAVGRGRVRMIS